MITGPLVRGASPRTTTHNPLVPTADGFRVSATSHISSRRWVSGKRNVPYFLVIMLRMMVSGTIDADDIERHR